MLVYKGPLWYRIYFTQEGRQDGTSVDLHKNEILGEEETLRGVNSRDRN